MSDEARAAMTSSSERTERIPLELDLPILRGYEEESTSEASEGECELLWPRLIAGYRSFANYRIRTRREIPIVILEAAGTLSG
jgi:hypothetical protein